eukprot:5635097-Lingulodinium_polyedra.AAC.1
MDIELQAQIDAALVGQVHYQDEEIVDSAPAQPAAMLGHEGMVHLDELPDGSTQLTHVKTVERRILPGGTNYHLIFDDEGFGAAVPEDTARDAIYS